MLHAVTDHGFDYHGQGSSPQPEGIRLTERPSRTLPYSSPSRSTALRREEALHLLALEADELGLEIGEPLTLKASRVACTSAVLRQRRCSPGKAPAAGLPRPGGVADRACGLKPRTRSRAGSRAQLGAVDLRLLRGEQPAPHSPVLARSSTWNGGRLMNPGMPSAVPVPRALACGASINENRGSSARP
jgi:hypothetical protein